MKLNPYQAEPFEVQDRDLNESLSISFYTEIDAPNLDGFYLCRAGRARNIKYKLYSRLSDLKQHVKHRSRYGAQLRLWVNLNGVWVEFRPDELLATKGSGQLMETILKRKVSSNPGV